MLTAFLLAFSLLIAAPQDISVEPPPELPAEEDVTRGDFDVMPLALDSRRMRLPIVGYVDLPPEGSWMVGPVDMTPTKHTVLVWLMGLLMLVVFIPAGQGAKRRQAGVTPKGGHNVVEALVLFFREKVVLDNIGPDGGKYVPYIATLFFFILFGNLLGLVPYAGAATSNIAVTGTLALTALVVIEVSGMRALGPAGYMGTIIYWNKELGLPVRILMAVIMSPVEIIGKLVKPFALAVRLMANMFAGALVIYSLIGLIFVFGSIWLAVGPVAITVALTFLKLFVAFLQAYIFALLTSVFIGLIRHAH